MALAARRLRVSQPTLSRQIRDLEERLAVRLFDRIGRRIVLAAEGREILARSRHLLAEAESLSERGRALGGARGGVLRVGATPQFIEAAMPRVLSLYRRRHPQVEIRLVEGGADALIDAVQQGHVHLAVPASRVVDPLESVLLYPLRVLAMMARRHTLASRRVLSAARGRASSGWPSRTRPATVWDPRRYLPPHAESFVWLLVACMRRAYPGHRLRLTREVTRPPESRPVGVGLEALGEPAVGVTPRRARLRARPST